MGVKMNETCRRSFVISVLFLLACALTGVAGYVAGSKHPRQNAPAGSRDSSVELGFEQLRLNAERDRTEREVIIGKVSTARDYLSAAIDAGGRANSSIQEIIRDMEDLVFWVSNAERELGSIIDNAVKEE
jgi:hypothetical protein